MGSKILKWHTWDQRGSISSTYMLWLLLGVFAGLLAVGADISLTLSQVHETVFPTSGLPCLDLIRGYEGLGF